MLESSEATTEELILQTLQSFLSTMYPEGAAVDDRFGIKMTDEILDGLNEPEKSNAKTAAKIANVALVAGGL